MFYLHSIQYALRYLNVIAFLYVCYANRAFLDLAGETKIVMLYLSSKILTLTHYYQSNHCQSVKTSMEGKALLARRFLFCKFIFVCTTKYAQVLGLSPKCMHDFYPFANFDSVAILRHIS